MSDTVKVVNVRNDSGIRISNGYMLKKGDNVAAFYADVVGTVNRAEAFASSCTTSVKIDGKFQPFPCLMLEGEDPKTPIQEIYFPEFPGWKVHCTDGGKTLQVCLTKD